MKAAVVMRLRRAFKVLVVTMTVSIGLAWAFTGWCTYYLLWRIGGGYEVTLSKGTLVGEYYVTPKRPALLHVGIVYGRCGWWFGFDHAPDGHVGVMIPLWAIFLVSAPLAAVMSRRDIVTRYRARIRACPSCGYDRRGLAADAKCPECGTVPTT